MTSAGPRRIRAAAVGVVAALAALVVWQGVSVLSDRSERADRADALRVAEAQVVDLTSLSVDTVEQRLASMEKRTEGDFKRQLNGIAGPFADTVRKDGITARGEVAESGFVRFTDDDAQVLVAADTAVTTAKASEPTDRSYRIQVSLRRSGDTWLVSGMEFVR